MKQEADEVKKCVKDRLKKLRDQSGCDTDAAFAKKLGVSRQNICKWLNESADSKIPDCTSLSIIAKNAGVTTDYLLGLTDDPSPHPAATDDLKLSADAVKALQKLAAVDSFTSETLSKVISCKGFEDMVTLCAHVRDLILVSKQCTPYNLRTLRLHEIDNELNPMGYTVIPIEKVAYEDMQLAETIGAKIIEEVTDNFKPSYFYIKSKGAEDNGN